MDKIIAVKPTILYKPNITNLKETNFTLKPILELTIVGIDGFTYQSEDKKIIVSDKVVENTLVFTPETLNDFISQLLQQKKILDESIQKAKLINDFMAESVKGSQ